jgi:hypothetical protein
MFWQLRECLSLIIERRETRAKNERLQNPKEPLDLNLGVESNSEQQANAKNDYAINTHSVKAKHVRFVSFAPSIN